MSHKRRILTFLVKRIALYIAVLLLIAGLFFNLGTWFGISLDQSDCQGGDSPVPNQGCGYVPYQDLYITGTTTGFVISYPLLLLGGSLLIIRAFILLPVLEHRRFILRRGGVLSLACFVIVITLVSTTYADTLVIYGQQQPLIRAQDAILSQCEGGWPPSAPVSNSQVSSGAAIMILQPGSVAKLCVTYIAQETGVAVSQSLNASIHPEDNLSVDLVPSVFQVSVQPETITAPALPDETPYMSAVFTIDVPLSARGLYVLTLLGVCPQIPVAIAYPQQINGSIFTNYLEYGGLCPGIEYISAGWPGQTSNNVGVAYYYTSYDVPTSCLGYNSTRSLQCVQWLLNETHYTGP